MYKKVYDFPPLYLNLTMPSLGIEEPQLTTETHKTQTNPHIHKLTHKFKTQLHPTYTKTTDKYTTNTTNDKCTKVKTSSITSTTPKTLTKIYKTKHITNKHK